MKDTKHVFNQPIKFISGLANCHIPGLYSLVLSERETPCIGMQRVFYASPTLDMTLYDGADFLVKPHTHRQDIELTLLCGDVRNYKLNISHRGTLHLWKYQFVKSVLLEGGGFELSRMWLDEAELTPTPLSETPIHMHWSDAHTVVATPGSAWLVNEGELAPAGFERCWSVSDHLQLNPAGLYTPLSPTELEYLAKDIQAGMEHHKKVIDKSSRFMLV